MIQSELYVNSRLAQIRSSLPPDRYRGYLAADVLRVSHYRREPDQSDTRYHEAVGDGAL